MNAPQQRERFWRVVGPQIVIEPLAENEYAVFHGMYWDSYMFNEIDVCLLRHLLQHSNSVTAESELIRIASKELDLPHQDLCRYAGDCLTQMAHVGLIAQEKIVENR